MADSCQCMARTITILESNYPQIKIHIKIKIRKYFDLNACENTAHENLWDKPKIILKGGNNGVRLIVSASTIQN